MPIVPNSEFRPFKSMHKQLCGVVSALKLPNMTDGTVNKSGHFPSVTSKRMNYLHWPRRLTQRSPICMKESSAKTEE